MTTRKALQISLSEDGRKYQIYLKTGKRLLFSDYMEVDILRFCEILVSSKTECDISTDSVARLFFQNKIFVKKIRKKKFVNVFGFSEKQIELISQLPQSIHRKNRFTFEGFCKLKRMVIFEKIDIIKND